MKSVEGWLVDPDPGAEWEVWYQDIFDRECPRQIEVAGRGLAAGLTELWARHLSETVQANGQKGFSRFNLWWKQEKKSVEVAGAWVGMVRLREWGSGDKELLMRIAALHGCLILAGQTSEGILAAAEASERREEFERRLLRMELDALGGVGGKRSRDR